MLVLCAASVAQVVGVSVPREVVLAAQSDVTAATVRIGVLHNGVYDVATLPLETYVARVLAGEALPGAASAAMEALAIAIRTYAIENRGRHQGDGFDLCDQTHCQVMRASSPVTERAAAATAGQILLYRGAPATVYYSASCGGHTEKPSNVWPGAPDPPYLPSQDDDGCGGTPAWSSEIGFADLERALLAAGFKGSLRDVRIARRNESTRVQDVQLDGMTPSRISGQDLRMAVGRTLGWQYVQSTLFELTRTGKAIRLRGQGNGHAVGLCVIGSSRLATAGRSATEILQQYFPGTTIGAIPSRAAAARPAVPVTPTVAPVPPGSVTSPAAVPAVVAAAPAVSANANIVSAGLSIELPDTDAGERGELAALITRERDVLSSTLGV
ncbi:MAG: SpoIID/LytB domain-containing protein, partial [Acidobacteriaceae bacterium]|nr:SpoIID/LytB domain-containing protein [Acidobacteriaceae bacterium]